jgi:membrane protease YdiL (CAAX protease family)
VFSNLHPVHIGFLSLIVAMSEEILFRGVLQSQFGIWIASLLFALVHFRYLSNLFLFTITIGLSFSLGILFFLTENLLTVIVAHFVIDFILGLLIRYQKLEKTKEIHS